MLNRQTTGEPSEITPQGYQGEAEDDSDKSIRQAAKKQRERYKKTTHDKSWIPNAPTAYAMANYSLIAKLAAETQVPEKKVKSRMWEALINQNMRRRYQLSLRDVVCREDMADYVLNLLRRQLVFQLGWLADRKGADYLRSCRKGEDRDKSGKELFEDLKVRDDVTSVLWLGPPEQQQAKDSAALSTENKWASSKKHGKKTKDQPKSKPIVHSSPFPSSPVWTIPPEDKEQPDWDPQRGPRPFLLVQAEMRKDVDLQRLVPVYNLPQLLGAEHLARVRQLLGDQLAKEEFLSIKAKAAPLEAQLLLIKLQFYLLPLPVWVDS